jgi:hypothetical protein
MHTRVGGWGRGYNKGPHKQIFKKLKENAKKFRNRRPNLAISSKKGLWQKSELPPLMDFQLCASIDVLIEIQFYDLVEILFDVLIEILVIDAPEGKGVGSEKLKHKKQRGPP